MSSAHVVYNAVNTNKLENFRDVRGNNKKNTEGL